MFSALRLVAAAAAADEDADDVGLTAGAIELFKSFCMCIIYDLMHQKRQTVDAAVRMEYFIVGGCIVDFF